MMRMGSNCGEKTVGFFFRAIFCVAALQTSLACTSTGNAEDASEPGGDQVPLIEPNCSLVGQLGLEFGEGYTQFVSLIDGAAPTLYHGPQGGTHLLLASRVHTPDPLDRYVVTVLAQVGNAECTQHPCAQYTQVGYIKTIVVGAPRVTVSGENTADVLGLFVLVDGWLAAAAKRISIDVSDDCNRQGPVVYEFTEGNGT